MFWRSTRKPSTRELLRAEHRPQAGRSGRLWRGGLLVALLLIAAALWLQRLGETAHATQLATLAEQNRGLEAALEQSQLQLQEARATEEQLLRRIAELSAQTKRLQTELAFFRQQKKR